MQLRDISYALCPICGAIPIAETQDKRHCNGHFNESRTFQCGCRVEFSPNFMKMGVTRECPQDPKEELKVKQRKISMCKLLTCIEGLKVDEDYKARLKRTFECMV